MKKVRKLTWEELKYSYPPSDFLFKTTDELECLDGMIGQERAKKAIEFGLSVKAQGYHIYISGEPGTGRTTLAKRYAKQEANQKPIPSDWCYVYNFRNKKVPKALCFKPGDGVCFRDDMMELIQYLTKEIPYMYTEDTYIEKKHTIINKNHEEKELRISQLQQYAEHLGFVVRIMEDRISFIPLNQDGDTLSEEDFEKLSSLDQESIGEKSVQLQEMAKQVITVLKALEEESTQKIENLEYDLALRNVGYYIKQLKERYGDNEKVEEYLNDLQQDILDNIQLFIREQDQEKNPMVNLLPWIKTNSIKTLVDKYKVNLIIDHSQSTNAPVIVDFNTTYNKVLGTLEYGNEFGNLSTDHMKIKPGLFHQANGGYLILQASELLTNYASWHGVKQILKTGQIAIENPQGTNVMTVATLNPEPIDIDVKVMIIGDTSIYQLLYDKDPEFKKIFKIRADVNEEIDQSQENAHLIGQFIKSYCKDQLLLAFSADAVKAVIWHASRYVENQKKLTAKFAWMEDLMIEAHTWARLQDGQVVDAHHVHLAMEEKRQRSGRHEDEIYEKIMDNTLMIETQGRQVGQINALAIYGGDSHFARPLKMTATTGQGKAGVINIEKEAKLSGNIHTKGIQVVAGYLEQTYAQDFPLSLTCRICFEQSYGAIDGDSASSGELYTIISSLAQIALKQNIAVTGSVNQHGLIQPVGGVTHKVEGFYKVCKQRGLTGDQGVMIPAQNILDLVLTDEVIEAVKKGEFHIYPITTIEEGIEILTDIPYEVIRQKIKDKLKKFNH